MCGFYCCSQCVKATWTIWFYCIAIIAFFDSIPTIRANYYYTVWMFYNSYQTSYVQLQFIASRFWARWNHSIILLSIIVCLSNIPIKYRIQNTCKNSSNQPISWFGLSKKDSSSANRHFGTCPFNTCIVCIEHWLLYDKSRIESFPLSKFQLNANHLRCS